MHKLPHGPLAHLRLRMARDWRFVMRHAWSVRLWVLSIALNIVAAVLPLFAGTSVGLTAALVGLGEVLAVAGLYARFVAQKGFEDETI